MADLEETISVYCDAWGEPEARRRREMLQRVLTSDATYTDPTVHVRDVDGLVNHIGSVLAQRPGARIERMSAADCHHGMVRFTWRVVLGDGSTRPEGVDFIELCDDGRIRRIVGFFGPAPPRPG